MFVATLYYGPPPQRRAMQICDVTNARQAAGAMIAVHGFDIHLGEQRWEQPWTDPADRLWRIVSFGTGGFSGQRIFVYEQIGGFERTLTDLREWGQP